MATKIELLRDEFFGKDKQQNYLKDDFNRVLDGVIRRDVLLHVVIECSKARHYEKRQKHADGSETILHGDYDPDNAGFLYPIIQAHDKALMVDLRQLLTPKEHGSGGSFVQSVLTLKTSDFLDYYMRNKDESVTLPPLLLNEFYANRQREPKLSGIELLDRNTGTIEKAVNDLHVLAATFRDSNYFDMLVGNYQALKFHKDRQPLKYNVREKSETFGAMTTTYSTRTDKATIEIRKVSECLNAFAGIIKLYQELDAGGTSFFHSGWPLETFVERTFALFSKEVPLAVRQKVLGDIIANLEPSLRITGWDYKK